eukprot:2535648-Rhodomonas_salina.2
MARERERYHTPYHATPIILRRHVSPQYYILRDVCGPDIGYDVTALRTCYAESGTDIGYATTRQEGARESAEEIREKNLRRCVAKSNAIRLEIKHKKPHS